MKKNKILAVISAVCFIFASTGCAEKYDTSSDNNVSYEADITEADESLSSDEHYEYIRLPEPSYEWVNEPSDFKYNITEDGIIGIDFSDDGPIENLIIPEVIDGITVTSIDYIFGDALNIKIPDTVTDIDLDILNDSLYIENIIIGNSVDSIDEMMFYNDLNLKNVVIGNSVTRIGMRAFNNCKSLTSITIPDSVTYISQEAFGECISLTNITIPCSVTKIDSHAFWMCPNIKDIYYSGTEEQWNEITIDKGNNNFIDANVHYNSDGSEQEFPEMYIYDDFTYLKNIMLKIVKYNNPAENPYDFSLIDYVIPENINGRKIIEIGKGAFCNCYNIRSIVIPNTIDCIDEWTFAFCVNLKSITIPASVAKIDSHAFWMCPNIEDIYYSGTEEQWNEIRIYDVDGVNDDLLNATIHYNS